MNDTNGQIEAVAHENIERTMSGFKDGVASATAGMEQAQTTMRDGMQKVMKTAEDMLSFSQGNVEAVTRSSQILATGMQDMGQNVAASTRASLDESVNTFKALAGVKSVKEAIDLQTSLFRSMIERTVSQTSQMTDAGMKLSEQAMAPIMERLSIAGQAFNRVG